MNRFILNPAGFIRDKVNKVSYNVVKANELAGSLTGEDAASLQLALGKANDRAAKYYKDNPGLLEKKRAEKARMAGDEIPEGLDKLIAGIKDEGKEERLELAVQDGRAYLDRQYGIEEEFHQAGVPSESIRGLQDIQMLSNGVPAPYVDTVSKPGIERRIHTIEDQNPITGQAELLPMTNDNTGGALVTEFGKNVDMEGQDKASEYVQDHILRLMGFNPQRGPVGKVDFFVEKNGQRLGIDGQAQEAGRAPVVEAFTKVIPTNRPRGGYGEGYAPKPMNQNRGTNTIENERAIRSDVRNSLGNAMSEGRTFDQAMNFLVDRGHFVDDRNIAGKLYKADYDAVLMPMQNQTQHRANAKYDDIAIAPDSVVMYNMADVKDHVKNISNPRQIRDAYNAGNNRRGEARVKLRADVPEQYVQDIVQTNPYVAQILRTLK